MIAEELSQIEAEIAALAFPPDLPELYDPLTYTLALGGKRIRPLLLNLACRLFSGNTNAARNQALAIELFHNFTLIHDDVMDNAPLRRGQPTVFKKWNQNIAILSGDVLFTRATSLMMKAAGSKMQQVMEIYLDTAKEVCEGQQIDMNFENREIVDMADYLHMIEFKTARLIAGGMQIGALMGGSKDEEAKALFTYGIHIGLAFQLMDDYLDVFGDAAKFGKRTGGDILSGKKTCLFINAIHNASAEDRASLMSYYSDQTIPEEKRISEVINIFQKYQCDSYIRQEVQHQLDESERVLEALIVDEETKQELIHLARKLTNREN